MLADLITAWRLKWYSIAVLFGIFTGLVIALLSGTGPKILSGRIGGDFPAFYAAGRIVANEGYIGLYNLDKQIELQKELFPENTGFLPFPYPPFVALVYVHLSQFSYRVAYAINLLFNIGAFLLAIFCLKKIIKGLEKFFLPVFTISFTFYPFLKAILNGQNSAITLLLIALVWRFTVEGKPYLAGILLALIIYKPQFLIPFIGLFILSGRYKIAISSVISSCLIVFFTVALIGIEPFEEWYNFLKWFVPADAKVNGHNAVSWIGFLDAVFGNENTIATALGYICSLVTVVIISWVWFFGRTRYDFNVQMAFACVGLVLIPPHVMFYDVGLTVLTYMVTVSYLDKLKIQLISFAWIFGTTQLVAKNLSFSPLFFFTVLTFFIVIFVFGDSAHQKMVLKAA